MRESGLKYKSSLPGQSRDLSLSMRESGLKSPRHYCTVMYYQSLSMRESGLKYNIAERESYDTWVSLHAREWIEIAYQYQPVSTYTVSLHAREWIEIIAQSNPS